MSRGRYPEVSAEIRKAVEEAALPRIMAPRDKELMIRFPGISRATLYRIIREARQKLMRQLSHSSDSKEQQNRGS